VASGEPQVIFAGRSNVGKSSLINALAGQKVARTSSKPGATRAIHLYRVDRRFWFVDLPGYGYARVSLKERAQWSDWIQRFLNTESDRRFSLLLVDSRVGPTPLDLEALSWLIRRSSQVLVVATKWDRVAISSRPAERERIERCLRSTGTVALATVSTRTGEGLRELAKRIAEFFAGSFTSQSQERKAKHEANNAGSSSGRGARRS
jgi:GTP-binding protein